MKVFILEDDHRRIQAFREALIGHGVEVYESTPEAIVGFKPPYDLLLLDHDLGGRHYVSSDEDNTGAGFCRWFIGHGDPCEDRSTPEIIIHSYNQPGAINMAHTLQDGGYRRVVLQPFGPTLLAFLKGLQ